MRLQVTFHPLRVFGVPLEAGEGHAPKQGLVYRDGQKLRFRHSSKGKMQKLVDTVEDWPFASSKSRESRQEELCCLKRLLWVKQKEIRV
jgi:hypothetical protein